MEGEIFKESGKGIKRRRKYDSEFRRNAVIMTQEAGRTVKAVAIFSRAS